MGKLELWVQALPHTYTHGFAYLAKLSVNTPNTVYGAGPGTPEARGSSLPPLACLLVPSLTFQHKNASQVSFPASLSQELFSSGQRPWTGYHIPAGLSLARPLSPGEKGV